MISNSQQLSESLNLDDRVFIEGPNFSGRSAIIAGAARLTTTAGEIATIIPPEVEPAFSGLMPDVASEIALHQRTKDGESGFELIRSWSMAHLASRNPYTLSGGEQTLLALVCKLALRPTFLGLDCALEQLDSLNLSTVLSTLADTSLNLLPPRLLVANNCESEALMRSGIFSRSVLTSNAQGECACPQLELLPTEVAPCRNPVHLKLDRISFRYSRGPSVLSNLHLQFEPGRVYRLAGPNGVGKSTLARILCGILKPTGGTILRDGRAYNPYATPGQTVRMHFQSPNHQLFEHTVAQELTALAPENRERAIRFASLENSLQVDPFDLPYVLRKRLALAITLFGGTPWLILDEPTLGQDAESRAMIAAQIRTLAEADYGVIVISHHGEFTDIVASHTINLKTMRAHE